MKLGVTFIAFSGLELLKPSIQNVRHFADHIVVVSSPISSTGESAPVYMKPLLDNLVKEGLVEEVIEYVPQIVHFPTDMQKNCRIKRNIGREACKAAGCTHHLIKDCDEFHDPGQFAASLEKAGKFDSSFCKLVEYVQKPTIQIKGFSGTCVPFLQNINLPLGPHRPNTLIADLGRTVVRVRTYHLFPTDELVMHHYTSVRYNEKELKRKYQGHGHLNRIGSLQDFLKKTESWPSDVLEEVPDRFGILEYWKGEFQQWASIDRS